MLRASATVHPGSESRANVKGVSREHGRAYCFPDETKPVRGQLVELSPGMLEASHSRHKRNTETRQGYPIRARSEGKEMNRGSLSAFIVPNESRRTRPKEPVIREGSASGYGIDFEKHKIVHRNK